MFIDDRIIEIVRTSPKNSTEDILNLRSDIIVTFSDYMVAQIDIRESWKIHELEALYKKVNNLWGLIINTFEKEDVTILPLLKEVSDGLLTGFRDTIDKYKS